jgi:hypothetical protein
MLVFGNLFVCSTIERFDVAIHEVRYKNVSHYGDKIGRECVRWGRGGNGWLDKVAWRGGSWLVVFTRY